MKKTVFGLVIAAAIIFASCHTATRNYILYNTDISLAIIKRLDTGNPQPLDKKYVRIFYQMMQDIDQVCTALDIPYWADGGTLLGAIRHEGFIKWDDDGDIDIPDTHIDTFNKKAIPVLEALGYTFQESPKKMFKVIDGDEFAPFFDILIATKGDDGYWRPRGWPKGVHEKDLMPLKRVKFGPTTAMIPQDPIPYLDDYYGKNWPYLANHGQYHKGERVYLVLHKKYIPFHLQGPDLEPAYPDLELENNKDRIEDLVRKLDN